MSGIFYHPQKVELHEKPIVVEIPGQALPESSLPKRVARSLDRARTMSTPPDPEHLRSSVLLPTLALAERAASEIRAFADFVGRAKLAEDHRTAELDELKRFGPQEGGPPFWWVQTYVNNNKTEPSSIHLFRDIVEGIADRCGKGTDYTVGTFPLGTNAGFPFCEASLAATHAQSGLGLILKQGAAGTREGIDRAVRVHSTIHRVAPTLPYTTIGTRSHLKESVPIRRLAGDKVVEVGKAYGLSPGRRMVWMMMGSLNHALLDVAGISDKMVLAHPALHRGALKADADRMEHARSLGMTIYEDDASGFDRSVVPEMLDVMADVWKARYPGSDAVYRLHHVLPIAMPGYVRSSAIMARKRGMISSGSRLTSKDGTMINAGVVTTSNAILAKWNANRAVEAFFSSEFYSAFQGDDTQLGIPKDWKFWTPEAYYEAAATLGQTRKIRPGRLFLKRIIGGGGPVNAHSLAARVLITTFWPESKPETDIKLIFGIAARFSQLRGNPLFDEAVAVVRRVLAGTKQLAVIDRALADPESVLADPEMIAAMASAALSDRELASYMARMAQADPSGPIATMFGQFSSTVAGYASKLTSPSIDDARRLWNNLEQPGYYQRLQVMLAETARQWKINLQEEDAWDAL